MAADPAREMHTEFAEAHLREVETHLPRGAETRGAEAHLPRGVQPAWRGELPAEYCVARWYAAYTSANHEKRVAEQMGAREVEHFLPLYASVRKWKDRRVTLELPLFPGYVFVRMALRDRLRVQQIPGVARLVGFDGAPAALPEEEIEALRTSLAKGVRAEPHPFLTVGRKVRVKCGPLAGVEGILLKRKGKFRVVISIELIQRAVAVEMELADVEAVR
jgi:transcription termination/antitermination protein NusG